MRQEMLTEWIAQTYNTDPEFPWESSPESMVFRHRENGKWFALAMAVPREKLGLPGGGRAWVLNVKVDPLEAGSLRGEPGVLPAYHMNKEHWITVLLDGTVEEAKVCGLIDLSFEATASKKKKTKT